MLAAILLASVLLVTTAFAAPAEMRGLLGLLSEKRLTFAKDGTFKVVSFSDMHFGERDGRDWVDWGVQQDVDTQRVHSTILDKEKPDYVVFNGDIVTGENLVFSYNATDYLDLCFKPTVDRKIPFSTTQGNHDNSFNITHDQIIRHEREKYRKLSYTRSDAGPAPYGNGNYWVPVYAGAWDRAPAMIMWFFDSRSFVTGAGPTPSNADYTWPDEHVVPNYIKAQTDLMKLIVRGVTLQQKKKNGVLTEVSQWGQVPPSLVFVHIPFSLTTQLTSLNAPGDHDDDKGLSVQGTKNGSYTGLDQPTWQAIVESISGSQGKVLAVTSGHDHGESWCAKSQASNGINYCFNGHSGYGGYDTPHSKVRNGRVFSMKLSDLKKATPSALTYNSYEDGSTGEYLDLSSK